jgi:sialate O-acetylesterase
MKLLAIVLLFGISSGYAQVRLPRLISDSMVLQRDARIRLWGWAAANEKITIRFQGRQFTTKTAANGKWQLWLPPMKAGGPYTMQVNTITIKDILIGDVWICSGQSNMVHQMELHSVTYANDIATANNGQIRHFWIKTMNDVKAPHDDLPDGSWKPANPENVRQFSAVAYFFAQKIVEKYRVPIGLINASVGGTPIESWTSEEGLKAFPDLQAIIQRNKDTVFTPPSAPPSAVKDKGLTGPLPWYDTAYIGKGWRTIAIPGYWEDQGVRDLNAGKSNYLLRWPANPRKYF